MPQKSKQDKLKEIKELVEEVKKLSGKKVVFQENNAIMFRNKMFNSFKEQVEGVCNNFISEKYLSKKDVIEFLGLIAKKIRKEK